MATAVLNAVLINDGGLPCDVCFYYGTDPTLATYAQSPWQGGKLAGDTIYAAVTGLAGNMTYYFRAVATNAFGTTYGAILSLFSSTAAEIEVQTLAATLITGSSARLNGMVIEDGDLIGSVMFEYGATREYGMKTGGVSGYREGDHFDADISGLKEGEAFHFRACFKNMRIAYGADMVFGTLSPYGPVTLIEDTKIEQWLGVI